MSTGALFGELVSIADGAQRLLGDTVDASDLTSQSYLEGPTDFLKQSAALVEEIDGLARAVLGSDPSVDLEQRVVCLVTAVMLIIKAERENVLATNS